MGVARVGPGAELDGFAAQARNVREGFFKWEVAEDRGKYANFHKTSNSRRPRPPCRGKSVWLHERDLPAFAEDDPAVTLVVADHALAEPVLPTAAIPGENPP